MRIQEAAYGFEILGIVMLLLDGYHVTRNYRRLKGYAFRHQAHQSAVFLFISNLGIYFLSVMTFMGVIYFHMRIDQTGGEEEKQHHFSYKLSYVFTLLLGACLFTTHVVLYHGIAILLREGHFGEEEWQCFLRKYPEHNFHLLIACFFILGCAFTFTE